MQNLGGLADLLYTDTINSATFDGDDMETICPEATLQDFGYCGRL